MWTTSELSASGYWPGTYSSIVIVYTKQVLNDCLNFTLHLYLYILHNYDYITVIDCDLATK